MILLDVLRINSVNLSCYDEIRRMLEKKTKEQWGGRARRGEGKGAIATRIEDNTTTCWKEWRMMMQGAIQNSIDTCINGI